MKVDPDTTIGQFLRAIPSSAMVFEEFGIRASSSNEKGLQTMCAEHGIRLEDFLQAIEDLDWSEQGPDRSAANL